MKTKLEIISLSNDDVITTSGCKDAHGWLYVAGEDLFVGYTNGYRQGMTLPETIGEGYEPGYGELAASYEPGYYHFKIEGGKIIATEKCPVSDTKVALDSDHHDIKLIVQ